MNTITKHVVLVILCLISTQLFAQEPDSTNIETIPYKENALKIDRLKELKKTIQTEEREYLKSEVETINQRLDRGEISQSQAESLKKDAAKKRALNIENRIAIVDNKISLLQRNDKDYDVDGNESFTLNIGSVTGIKFRNRNKPRRYDRRTTSDLVFAFGLNNTLIDGQGLDESPYKIGTSGFIELGVAWKTRLFKNTNAVRLKYGFSFQWNKLKPKDNMYFEQNGDQTVLAEFPLDLRKSKFRVTNLVFPVHFEFGPSRKIERKNYFRYSTYRNFKIGVGAYGGFRLGTLQKLKYKEDGDRVKDKIKRNYNVSDLVYGLSAYVGFGETSLYMKYDLNPLFKDQAVDQHNISMGVRFDFD